MAIVINGETPPQVRRLKEGREGKRWEEKGREGKRREDMGKERKRREEKG